MRSRDPAPSPPGLHEAEQAIIGAALADADTAPAAVGAGLLHEHFADPAHRAIWAAVATGLAQGAGTDLVDVFARLQAAGQQDLCGGLEHLSDLACSAVAAVVAGQPERVRQHARRIQQAAHARRLLGVAEDLAAGLRTDEALARARAELQALEQADKPLGPAGFILPLRDEPGHAAQPHPLTAFVDVDCEPRPPRFVVPWFVQDGVVVVAGTQGAGKTTVLVPMAMLVAGLHAADDELAPRHWRHVVYIAEDVAQVQRIVSGVVRHAGLGIDPAAVVERFHLVAARRMPADQVAAAGPYYREHLTREIGGVELPPLVVIDTRSATIDVADENDNAAAGRILATFKQGFAGLPVWLIGHLAKALTSRKDVQALSLRGASAIEADAHQTMFLVVEDDGRRFLVLGKRRFEPRWTELEVLPGIATATARDEWGEAVSLTLRWGRPVPPTQTRAEARQDHEEQDRIQRERELRGALLDAVGQANSRGLALSTRTLCDRVQGFGTPAKRSAIGALVSECWLVEARVPAGWRLRNNSCKTWLIALAAEERRVFVNTGELPQNKLKPPASIAIEAAAEQT